jgi:hypothetical protein
MGGREAFRQAGRLDRVEDLIDRIIVAALRHRPLPLKLKHLVRSKLDRCRNKENRQ